MEESTFKFASLIFLPIPSRPVLTAHLLNVSPSDTSLLLVLLIFTMHSLGHTSSLGRCGLTWLDYFLFLYPFVSHEITVSAINLPQTRRWIRLALSQLSLSLASFRVFKRQGRTVTLVFCRWPCCFLFKNCKASRKSQSASKPLLSPCPPAGPHWLTLLLRGNGHLLNPGIVNVAGFSIWFSLGK